jgi:hypothetical protein
LNKLSRQKQIPLKWLIGLSAALLLIILVAGLRPRWFQLSNNVAWITDQPGLRFGSYGVAYTHPLNDLIEENISDAEGFSIEIALKPARYRGRRYKIILALHNGKDAEQLIVAQYLSSLIVMNGDDYAYTKKIKRVTLDVASLSPKTRFMTITTGEKGTNVYFDGKPAGARKNLRLKMPTIAKTRLLIGNSVYGKHPWQGDIFGLALYNYPLSSKEAALHFNKWSKERNFSFAGNENPFILYLFDEKRGTKAHDRAAGNYHLEIPSRPKILQKKILVLPVDAFRLKISSIADIIINLAGFIPFGFVIFATFIRFGSAFEKHGLLITVALCFMVSLTIEILQAWIPSRSSSMLDLVLNTLGAWLGAFAYRFFNRWVYAAGIRPQAKG